MFEFYFQQGKHRRKLFQSVKPACSIGSARGNDLVLESRLVSKRHAQFYLQADGLFVKDLGSVSGTWINRERVLESGPLSELDEIEIGDVSLSIRRVKTANHPVRTENPVSTEVQSAERRTPILSLIAGIAEPLTGSSTTQAGEILAPMADDMRQTSLADKGPTVDSSTQEASHADNFYPGRRADSDRLDAVGSSTRVGSVDKPEALDNQEMVYWVRVIHEQLLYQMDLQRKDINRMSDEELREESLTLIQQIIESLSEQLPSTLDQLVLRQQVLDESVGLGPLESFLADDSITEIMVNNSQEIFVERHGKLERSPRHFSSDATVYSVIERILTPLGRRLDEGSPIVDARLKDGSRVNAVIPPLALKGPSLTIRKFSKNRLSFADLIGTDSVSPSMVEFLEICVKHRRNIVVSGGTGSGKTTLLNVLSNFIPDADRIVTIEDAAELKLIQPNLVSLEARPPNLEGKGEIPIRDLVRNALRMRPDRIVVGECRGGEAIDMLQAMNTGHDGSLTTLHANTPRDALSRLEVLVLMAGMELPVLAIREQVASAVDLIIQQSRFACGARKITRITEVVGVESGTVQLQDIFRFNQTGQSIQGQVVGDYVATGAIPTFYESLRQSGVSLDLGSFSQLSQGSLL